jgi:hypothetical protein
VIVSKYDAYQSRRAGVRRARAKIDPGIFADREPRATRENNRTCSAHGYGEQRSSRPREPRSPGRFQRPRSGSATLTVNFCSLRRIGFDRRGARRARLAFLRTILCRPRGRGALVHRLPTMALGRARDRLSHRWPRVVGSSRLGGRILWSGGSLSAPRRERALLRKSAAAAFSGRRAGSTPTASPAFSSKLTQPLAIACHDAMIAEGVWGRIDAGG